MRFAYDLTAMPYLLAALGCGLLVALFATSLVLASIRRGRATTVFGDPKLVMRLETFDAAGRRALKGVLLVVALTSAFLALARPQWGRGTKLVPATNLDVVIVLDYSKSMYARDVAPSRIARAKAEIGKLVRELPGARFGAVAFAGEPMSFPRHRWRGPRRRSRRRREASRRREHAHRRRPDRGARAGADPGCRSRRAHAGLPQGRERPDAHHGAHRRG